MIPEPRFAIYLAPEPHEALWQFGSAWLGYDAETRACPKHLALPGLSPETIREATAHPRLYGLHITLKAPFRLAEGLSVAELEQAVAQLAQRHAAFGPVPLALEARKAGEGQVFLCLAPSERSAPLHALEADAVVALDRFRAPLTTAEIARRKPERLQRKERAYLDAHGYPYVLDAYRPHISLTGPIPADSPIHAALADHLAQDATLTSWVCRSVLLFEQPEAGARFHIRQRFALG